MLKQIIAGVLSTVVVGAVGVSAYNTSTATNVAAQAVETAEATAPSIAQESFQVESSEVQGDVYAQSEEQGLAQTETQNEYQNEYQTQGQGQGQEGASESNGNGYQGGRNETADDTRSSGTGYDSQNAGMEQATVHGFVTGSELATVTLTTDAGETLSVFLDTATLGITLLPNDGITLGGYWNPDSSFTVGQITLDVTGETFAVSGNGGSSGTGYRGGGSGGGGKGNR